MHNLIHLHGDVHSDPEDWVLRPEQLEEDWKDEWEQFVVTRGMTSSIVVFAGLGSPAAVLTETLGRIKAAMADNVALMVSPGAFEESQFAATCAVESSAYVQLTWNAFMQELGERVVKEQIHMTALACEDLIRDQNLAHESTDALLSLLSTWSLVGLGVLRGTWLLSKSSYEPLTDLTKTFIADILLAIGTAVRIADATPTILLDGNLELREAGGKLRAILIPASGQGTVRWAQLEAKLVTQARLKRNSNLERKVVLGCGVVGRRDFAPPADLIPRRGDDSIIEKRSSIDVMLDLDDLTNTPSLLTDVLA